VRLLAVSLCVTSQVLLPFFASRAYVFSDRERMINPKKVKEKKKCTDSYSRLM
jgi:hypothetical protein